MVNNSQQHNLTPRESVYHLNVVGNMRSAQHKPVYIAGSDRVTLNGSGRIIQHGSDRIILNGSDRRVILNGTDRPVSEIYDSSGDARIARLEGEYATLEMCENVFPVEQGEQGMEEILKGNNKGEAFRGDLVNWTTYREGVLGYLDDDESIVENETNVEQLSDAGNGNHQLVVRTDNVYGLSLTATDQESNNRIQHVMGVTGVIESRGTNYEKDLAVGPKNAGQIFTDEMVRRLTSDMEALHLTDEAMDDESKLSNGQDSVEATKDVGKEKSIEIDTDRPDSPMSTMSSLFGRSPSPDAQVPPPASRSVHNPNYTVHNNRITVHTTDALATRRPLHHPTVRTINPDGSFIYFERIPLAHEISKHWRECLGTFIAKHVLKLQVKADGIPLMLSRFPDDYVLYMLKSGTTKNEMNADVSYYLYGSRYVNHFRSPMEFGLHLKWLMKGMPMRGGIEGLGRKGKRGTRRCLCVHCRDDGVSQKDIRKRYFGASGTKKRKNGSGMSSSRGVRRRGEDHVVDLAKAKDYRSAGAVKVSRATQTV
ncbi:uncharacterized protein STEHIDRAFT_109728 [Stereum hirsutum FP-91666 SS1]|uniref:uncharacterized protein n=1 Tax=Stereum hirsutum (strain FP-91666) TaxID=721885 RepID=UPI000440B199|nr:uncharacterized protein STEHIDRAFT_109728 [Stereum hirsutum FP-91666 SS1]EIM87856.1 hypothetical protein STEHIDRAFT_109728 [Stereum hirsutum FP-91666 SS1]